MSLCLVCLWQSDYIHIIYLCHIVLPLSTEFHNRNAYAAVEELQWNIFMTIQRLPTLLTKNHYIAISVYNKWFGYPLLSTVIQYIPFEMIILIKEKVVH